MLERTPILPSGGPDGGSRSDSGARDAGTDGAAACPASGCDDANPCTDDRCVPGEGCVFEPNTASCDDGILCNGADTCSEGTCVHDMVDPCPGASSCNPETNACEGCATDADCPEPMNVPSGVCTAADPCATSGTEAVTITTFTCDAVTATCVQTDTPSSQECMRETDGVSCGDATTEKGDCEYASPCAETGSRTVTTRAPVCMGGTCMEVVVNGTEPCSRSTGKMPCGPPVRTMGTCSFESTCAESGTRTDTIVTPVCDSGACSGTDETSEVQTCTRDTDGTRCGACTPYSECTYTEPESCSGEASRGRLCPTCTAGVCPSTPATLDLDNTCSPPTRCTDDIDCTCEVPGGGCPSGSAGTLTCVVTYGTCNGSGMCRRNGTNDTLFFPCTCP